MFDVVAIGELLIDFTTDSTQDDGYPVMAAHPGGAVANFLAPLAHYGKRTVLISKVGNDAFGKLLTDTLHQFHIDTSGVKLTDSAFTTLAFVTRDENGDRSFSFARKPGADITLTAEEIDYSLIDKAQVFHFGTVGMTAEPSRTAHKKAVEYAKKKGKLISFDPNLRESLWDSLEEAKAQILWGLSLADVVKISDNEVEFLFGMDAEKGAQHIFATYHPKLLYVTLGKNGALYRSQNAMGSVPNYDEVKTVDTTGAGDIFGGSAMFALLETGKAPEDLTKEELKRITAFACKNASLSTECLGGISSVKNLASLS